MYQIVYKKHGLAFILVLPFCEFYSLWLITHYVLLKCWTQIALIFSTPTCILQCHGNIATVLFNKCPCIFLFDYDWDFGGFLSLLDGEHFYILRINTTSWLVY